MNPSRVAVSSSRCAKDQKYREGVTCASVVLPEKLCVEIPTQANPTHLPSGFGQCRDPRVQWRGVREQCQGLGLGDSDLWAKSSRVEWQLSEGPAAVLAQPSLKEMLVFMLAQKNQKIPLSLPKGHQGRGASLKGFPSLSELLHLTWCG